MRRVAYVMLDESDLPWQKCRSFSAMVWRLETALAQSLIPCKTYCRHTSRVLQSYGTSQYNLTLGSSLRCLST